MIAPEPMRGTGRVNRRSGASDPPGSLELRRAREAILEPAVEGAGVQRDGAAPSLPGTRGDDVRVGPGAEAHVGPEAEGLRELEIDAGLDLQVVPPAQGRAGVRRGVARPPPPGPQEEPGVDLALRVQLVDDLDPDPHVAP